MLTSGPPHRGSSICTCHWRLSEDRLGTPRSGFQPPTSSSSLPDSSYCLLSRQPAPNNSNPSASADGIELVPPSTQPPLENERTWVHLSTSTRHPPSSPQAPILLLERLFLSGPQPPKPSASADGIDHLPPYTQLPLQNEPTRVDPSTLATHPPPPRSLPRPPTTWSLLPRPTESTISPPPPSCLWKTTRPGPTHRPRRRTPPVLSPGPQPPEAFCLGRRNRPSPPLHPAAFGKRHDPGRPIDLGDAPPLLSPGPQPPA
ncbi:hypothetical protein PGTUg99_007350 [Puccinia graminis f. sp. tritici]|uniref:Uncharacterized protein n=1 Tax=Puccinia graminis f. sp. tritici TaxID=56615 RepID=A0A5B0N4V3_PUCGR|nr:hypothetical protein PGTUg99_007350 [Puccinia graminis f. sp. tritici]